MKLFSNILFNKLGDLIYVINRDNNNFIMDFDKDRMVIIENCLTDEVCIVFNKFIGIQDIIYDKETGKFYIKRYGGYIEVPEFYYRPINENEYKLLVKLYVRYLISKSKSVIITNPKKLRGNIILKSDGVKLSIITKDMEYVLPEKAAPFFYGLELEETITGPFLISENGLIYKDDYCYVLLFNSNIYK